MCSRSHACGKAIWSRSDPDPDTRHFLPIRYGVSMLQVVRVHLGLSKRHPHLYYHQALS